MSIESRQAQSEAQLHGRASVTIRATTTPVGFALKFIVYFAVLFGAFEASLGSAFERFVVEDLILAPTTGIIDTITPSENVRLTGRVISSPRSQLRVTRGCEGVEMFLMLAAGILAFPASWRRRAQGLLAGSVLAYMLSVGRLMALYYILSYSPHAWEALHGLVLPLGPIIVMALYFLGWSSGGSPAPVSSESRAT